MEIKPLDLSEFVESTAQGFGIPGASVGVLVDGKQSYATYGVTSIENPLPVDTNTLFLLGSVSKTYTATALMRLVFEGRIELDAPVRRYIPELKLADEQTAAAVTVKQLLNHTSGMSSGMILETGEGDNALANYVAALPELHLIASPGQMASYSQAGYSLAGRVIEKVTGMTFESAMATLLFEPLGLSNSFSARDEVMTRRFAVGHNRSPDGKLSIARLWRRPRGDNPGGGIAASIADQIWWAKFHLGDGHSENGKRFLPANLLQYMKQPSVTLRGSNFGTAIGIGWFLREVDGAATIGHLGSANGQFAEIVIVPDRGLAVCSLSNAGPDGIPFNHKVVQWVLKGYLGLTECEPETMPFDESHAVEYVGRYSDNAQEVIVSIERGKGIRIGCHLKPEIRGASTKDFPPDHEPFEFSFLPGGQDEYIIISGAFKGLRGYFDRDKKGDVVGIHVAGRQYRREPNVAIEDTDES